MATHRVRSCYTPILWIFISLHIHCYWRPKDKHIQMYISFYGWCPAGSSEVQLWTLMDLIWKWRSHSSIVFHYHIQDNIIQLDYKLWSISHTTDRPDYLCFYFNQSSCLYRPYIARITSVNNMKHIFTLSVDFILHNLQLCVWMTPVQTLCKSEIFK